MTAKELRKLKRIDLLEMLIEQSRENETLKQQLSEATEQLEQRDVLGSIAEAALQRNGVSGAAKNTGVQYLVNIERVGGEQEKSSARMMEESREKAARLLSQTVQKCRAMVNDAQKKSEEMLVAAEHKSKAHRDAPASELESFYDSYERLQQLLSMDIKKGP